MENEEIIPVELETLTLGHYDYVTSNHSAVQLCSFVDEESGNEIYNVTLLLWLKTSSNVGDVPIAMETQIYDECEYCAAYAGIKHALALAGSVYNSILVFDEEGDVIEELDVPDIMEQFEDDDLEEGNADE